MTKTKSSPTVRVADTVVRVDVCDYCNRANRVDLVATGTRDYPRPHSLYACKDCRRTLGLSKLSKVTRERAPKRAPVRNASASRRLK